MDDFEREALRRLPLAEAALRLWAFITNESFLSSVFARHRGRSYEKVLSFPVMVNLIADALLRYRCSGRRSFSEAKEQGTLQASIVAAFAKLRRLPISLSMGFLADCTARLVALFPDDLTTVPLPAWSQSYSTAKPSSKWLNASSRCVALAVVSWVDGLWWRCDCAWAWSWACTCIPMDR